jgi:bifunctional enzyme CysN/CysC
MLNGIKGEATDLEPSTFNLSPSTAEDMNIVIVGHVDHGKSTVIGRLLADTGSLPEGKLDQVRRNCELNAKPFEYAFLLDALKDEQAQGITIDTARCFFKTAKRHYIIIDAPGHIEFLKNMITGAARAEAALLVIDAYEGVRENSRRHGFMLSLLGISQIVVLVNKMDLAGYRREVFEQIQAEYRQFLQQINVEPLAFIPISAREGDNLAFKSERMDWYQGPFVLELIDEFQKEKIKEEQPFRFPVQDIYKFTEAQDDRRIFAGTVETGWVRVGEEVIFLPSQKRSRILSIEGFNVPETAEIAAGNATGFTLETQVYIKPGEIMCRVGDRLPHVATSFKANIFWMGRHPMVTGKKYKMKLVTHRATVYLQKIERVLDASNLNSDQKNQIDRHDVAECILQTIKPIAFDLSRELEATGRFVIIDNYEIVGGGIITEYHETHESVIAAHVNQREILWEKSNISAAARAAKFHQRPMFVIITGEEGKNQTPLVKALEEDLFKSGHSVYYLSISNLAEGLDSDVKHNGDDREESIRRIGELARLFTDAGQIFITNIPSLDEFEIEILKKLNAPNDILVINLGSDLTGTNALTLNAVLNGNFHDLLQQIKKILYQKDILLEYYI